MSKSFESTPTSINTGTHTTSAHKTHKTPSWFVPISCDQACVACGQKQELEDILRYTKCTNLFPLSCTELPNYELIKYQKTNKRTYNLYKRKYTCLKCTLQMHPNDCENIARNRLKKLNEEGKSEIKKLAAELQTHEEKLF